MKSISAGRPANPALDFEALKQQGIELLRHLAGSSWTDHNEHDPGITILEQLCFALTELSYRADLPIEDLLGDPATGALDPVRTGLFPAEMMLTGAPVTTSDYRRLLIDRVPGAGNAWLLPATSGDGDRMAGLHEIELYIPDPSAVTDAAGRRTAARIARRIYARHRGLCEDVVGVHVLKTVPAQLRATLSIDASAAPEAVLARVFYEAGLFLAPEARRQSLESRLGHVPLAEVFSGPLPTSGFIDDDQLQPRRAHVELAELSQVLERTEGVALVRDLELATPFGVVSWSDPILPVPGRRVLQLDPRDADGWFAVRLIRDGVALRPDPAMTRRELQRLWLEHRQRYDISAERRRLLAPLAGTPGDLGGYHSIQHQFPDVYGINARGLPAGARGSRRAQARQLKAYLLIFEQILADAFARLASVEDLFSTGRPRRSAASAFLDASVPDVAPLLAPSYRTRLPAVLRSGDRPLERSNRALDLMLATYGESLGQPVLSPRTSAPTSPASARVQVRAKRALLRRLPWLAGRRGCGIDYLNRSPRRGLVSVEVKSRIQLGMEPVPRPLPELLQAEGVALIGTAPGQDRVWMIRYARHIDASFEPIVHVPAPPPRTGGVQSISEDLLLAAGDQAHYRIGSLPDTDAVTVVCRAPSQPIWQLVGQYHDRATALSEVAHLIDTVRRIDGRLRRLTIVEHTLLRFGRSAEPAHVLDPVFDCRFTATALVALPAREASDALYRSAVHDALRANTPAHIVLDVRFLRLSDAAAFEALHGEWLRTLRDGPGRHRMDACRRMRAFLQAGRP